MYSFLVKMECIDCNDFRAARTRRPSPTRLLPPGVEKERGKGRGHER